MSELASFNVYLFGVARTDFFFFFFFFTHAQEKIFKRNMLRIASKIEATLKGKNLLPEGANSFL